MIVICLPHILIWSAAFISHGLGLVLLSLSCSLIKLHGLEITPPTVFLQLVVSFIIVGTSLEGWAGVSLRTEVQLFLSLTTVF
jgi:hypothetical protein